MTVTSITKLYVVQAPYKFNFKRLRNALQDQRVKMPQGLDFDGFKKFLGEYNAFYH